MEEREGGGAEKREGWGPGGCCLNNWQPIWLFLARDGAHGGPICLLLTNTHLGYDGLGMSRADMLVLDDCVLRCALLSEEGGWAWRLESQGGTTSHLWVTTGTCLTT